MVPWVILSWRLASSLASLANSFPARLQGSDSSIKIAVSLPNCRKRSNAVFFVPHRLDHSSCTRMCCLDFSLGVFVRCFQLPLSVQSAPQISYNLCRQHSYPPLAPVSLCPPLLPLSLLSSLSRFLPQRSASFVLRF